MRKVLIQTLTLALIPLVPATLSAFVHPIGRNFANVMSGQITVSKAMEDPSRFLWIDARLPSNYESGHVPGALSINEKDWDNLLPLVLEAWPTGKDALVYCDSSQCRNSENVAQRLREFNIGSVYVLAGGWNAWLAGQDK